MKSLKIARQTVESYIGHGQDELKKIYIAVLDNRKVREIAKRLEGECGAEAASKKLVLWISEMILLSRRGNE